MSTTAAFPAYASHRSEAQLSEHDDVAAVAPTKYPLYKAYSGDDSRRQLHNAQNGGIQFEANDVDVKAGIAEQKNLQYDPAGYLARLQSKFAPTLPDRAKGQFPHQRFHSPNQTGNRVSLRIVSRYSAFAD
jgi:hypothetical protein